ncbi:MAG: Riboflavin transporter RfnT [Pseudomonadota bacterium]|jgi:predicted MFS family arabinose efflux permease
MLFKTFDSARANRSIVLLALCQGLLLTNTVILMAVNGLTGFMLAPSKALATLPAMTYVVGSALSAMPVSAWMKRVGRRRAFMHFTLFAIVGASLCAYAVSQRDFYLLCFGTFFIGTYAASGALYRFAAADSVGPQNKARAISLVLLGGIAGGLLGPESSKISKDWLNVTYAGTYLSLIVFALLALLIQSRLQLSDSSVSVGEGPPARPLTHIMRQPKYLLAVLAAAIGYGVMNLLMVATPLAMSFCGHPYKEAVFVLEWHVAAMFLPSLFTGDLIKKMGVYTIIGLGVVLNFAAAFILFSGQSVAVFWLGLAVLGVGWNFMYLGGTNLLTETYTASEKNKAQGANDALVFLTMALSSSAAGALVNTQGWHTVIGASLPFIALAGLALCAYWLLKRNK